MFEPVVTKKEKVVPSSKEAPVPEATRSYRPWTLVDDVEVCKAVVQHGLAGKTLRPVWFQVNVVGKVPALQDRTAGSLANRYKRVSCRFFCVCVCIFFPSHEFPIATGFARIAWQGGFQRACAPA
jgi:hypothetical protein